MKYIKFDLRKSVESDYKFCESIDKKCLDKIIELDKELKLSENNPEYFRQLNPNLNAKSIKKSEIQRLKTLQKNLISKKYVFENKTVYVTQRPYLIGDRDQIDHINNIEYISKDHEYGRFYLNFQLNQKHNKLGQVLEVWEHYDIEQSNSQLYDLKNIRFETLNGRDFCESYRELILGENIESKKINIKKIFSYKSIIQSPEQNKFYDWIVDNKKKYILVNGQAGTGKTTVAIDALKNIKAIFMVLNNTKKIEIEEHFRDERNPPSIILFKEIFSFLKDELNINDSLELNKVEDLADEIISRTNKVRELLKQKELNTNDEYKKIFETIQFLILSNKIETIEIVDISEIVKKLENELLRSTKYINNFYFSKKVPFLVSFDSKDISKIKFSRFEPDISKKIKTHNDKSVILKELRVNKVLNKENIKYTNKARVFSFLNKVLKNKSIKFEQPLEQSIVSVIEKVIYSKEFISKYFFEYKNPDIVKFAKYYLASNTDFPFFSKIDKTILIDEYQQLQNPEIIDLLKIAFNRVILIGDNLQTDSKNIYKKRDVFEQLIFSRNFRQTYQLAVASLIVRNLLDESVSELPKEKEYYKDQIEFNGKHYKKPYLYQQQELEIDFILKRLTEIKNNQIDTYEHSFPIMLVVKESLSLSEVILYKGLAQKYKIIRFQELNGLDIESFDFIFLTIQEIQGEEAPIVVYISDDAEINLAHLYISITRAQFEFYSFLRAIPVFSEDKLSYLNIILDNKEPFDLKQKTSYISDQEYKKKIESTQHQMLSKKENNNIVLDESVKTSSSINTDSVLTLESSYHNSQEVEVDYTQKTEEEKRKERKSAAEQILNHERHIDSDPKINHNPSIVKDNEKFQEDFIKKQDEKISKIIDDSVSINQNSKNKFKKKNNSTSNQKMKKFGDEETKNKFKRKDWYSGQCQICGFTFQAKDGFHCERFTWTDFGRGNWTSEQKRMPEHNIVDESNSLCLCSRCHSILKHGGQFSASFLTHEFKNKLKSNDYTYDDFIEDMEIDKPLNHPECFKEHVEWKDMYFLEIKLNNKEEHIYFTEEHLIAFFTFLKS